MKKTRILALVLAVVMVAALFVGCSNTENPADTTAATTTAATTTAATTTEATTTEATTTEATTTEATTTEATTTEATTTEATTTEEPKIDLEGYEFIVGIKSWEVYYPTLENALHDEWRDEYDRIQDEYNFILNIQPASYKSADAATYIMSGDFPYDVHELKTCTIFPWAMRNGIQNMAADEMLANGIDVNDPNLFYQPSTQWTNLKGGTWGFTFASKYSLPEYGYCLMFNKDLCDSAGYPAEKLYELARNREWTFDVYKDLCSKIVKDNDGDGVYDVYATGGGYSPWCSEIMLAGGNCITEVDGKLVYTLDTPEALKGLEFMQYEFAESGWRNYTPDPDGFTCDSGEDRAAFENGKVGILWAPGHLLTDEEIKAFDVDFGYLPMPICAPRTEYVDVFSTPKVLCMYANNPDLEKNCQALKIWASVINNAENWKDEFRDYFCRGDETDWEIFYDCILTKVEFGTYKISDEMASLFESEAMDMIVTGERTAAQAIEAVQPGMQKLLDDMFNQ